MSDIYHVFEKAGLGVAPFRLVDVNKSVYQACPGAPIQPGSSCDYCGNAIMIVCVIRDVNGKEFKVGSDCVMKTGDLGLKSIVKQQVNAIERERRHDANKRLIESAFIRFDEVSDKLRELPHPVIAHLTLCDYVAYLMKNGGETGKAKAARMILKHAS